MARNIIEEIISIRERLPKTSKRFSQVFQRLMGIMELLEDIKESKIPQKSRSEILRYIPIGLVACCQGYFRSVFKNLIDYGSPYKENIKKRLTNKKKLDNDTVLAITGKTITLGEFNSHSLPINNFESIDTIMTELLGEDLLEKLKTVKIRGRRKLLPQQKKFVETAMQLIIKPNIEKIKKTFELRHIFCHELANKTKLSIAEAEDQLYSTFFFIFGVELLVSDLLKKKSEGAQS